MGHSCVRIKVRRRKVANLAAYSRQFPVNNSNKSISPKVEHKLYYDEDMKNAITCPFTKHKFIPTNPHPIPTKYGVSITGYDWVEPEGQLWKHEKHPQPKSSWNVIVDGKPTLVKSTSLHKDPVKMTKQEYWEKLVQHKLTRWERKNPKPVQDLFEKVEDWEQQRSIAEERFRDFVVSTYDKLLVTAAVLPLPTKDIVLAKIKDCGGGMNGDENAKIAREIAKKAMKENSKILHCQLLDHKRKEYRIVA